MKTLVIGLGNPILGDDGVGWQVAQEVERHLLAHTSPAFIVVECLSLGGISLMETMVGWQRVILVDALDSGQHRQGEVVTFSLDSVEEVAGGHSGSVHDLSLKNALKLGRSLGADLPRDEDIQIVAIEARNVFDFDESLSPVIAAAVPEAARVVMSFL